MPFPPAAAPCACYYPCRSAWSATSTSPRRFWTSTSCGGEGSGTCHTGPFLNLASPRLPCCDAAPCRGPVILLNCPFHPLLPITNPLPVIAAPRRCIAHAAWRSCSTRPPASTTRCGGSWPGADVACFGTPLEGSVRVWRVLLCLGACRPGEICSIFSPSHTPPLCSAVRGREPRGLPQAQHRGAAGLVSVGGQGSRLALFYAPTCAPYSGQCLGADAC